MVKIQEPANYIAKSKTTQFVSTNLNIGNYMPVFAIQEMLGEATDVWNIHRPIDWDFVNANYETAVIGGAGLLHKVFEPFWADFRANCRLPYVIWGIGLCAQDSLADGFCDPGIVAPVFDEALAVNVRDYLTARTYGAESETPAVVTECPTVFYLRDFEVKPIQNQVTLVMHPDLISDEQHDATLKRLQAAGLQVKETLNIAASDDEIPRLIRDFYCESSLVVSSRLHGAITAYGLGMPYIAIAGDEKLREFQRIFGGGLLVNEVSELSTALDDPWLIQAMSSVRMTKPQTTHITAFGDLATALLSSKQKH